MNRTEYQAIVRRGDGETKRRNYASHKEAFAAIWPAMQAMGFGVIHGVDGVLHDRDFIYSEMAAGVFFGDGEGGSWGIVNHYDPAFVGERP